MDNTCSLLPGCVFCTRNPIKTIPRKYELFANNIRTKTFTSKLS